MTVEDSTVSKGGPRPLRHVADLARRYPLAWRQLGEMRAEQGRRLPGWPSWCWVPMAGAHAVVTDAGGHPRDIAPVAAVAAWRQTQGIYRIDPTVAAAVATTPLERDLPSDVLERLPEWSVYTERPPGIGVPAFVHGWYAHLEWDAKSGRSELRFVLDTDLGLIGAAIHLGGTLADGLQTAARREAERQARLSGVELRSTGADLVPILAPLVNLTLYLCADERDLADPRGRRDAPGVVRDRRSRETTANAPTFWEVGYRLGAAIRRAEGRERAADGGTHTSPRPHVRRAHWHTFLRGPRSGTQERVLRWLPPIPVNADEPDDLVPTIRPIR